MKVPYIAFCLLLFSLSCLYNATAQDVKGNLAQLNSIFNGSVTFDLDREDLLTIDLYNEQGHYRQDKVYMEFLDPGNVSYVSEERALVLRCSKEHKACIDKEIFKLKTLRHTGRTTLPLSPGSPDIDRASMLFSSLIEQIKEEADPRTSETRKGK